MILSLFYAVDTSVASPILSLSPYFERAIDDKMINALRDRVDNLNPSTCCEEQGLGRKLFRD